MANEKSPIGLVAFEDVFTPSNFNPERPQYQITLLFDENDPGIGAMRDVIKQAAMEKWGNQIPSEVRTPLRNGAEKEEKLPHFAGKIYARFASKFPPGLVGPDCKPIGSDKFWAGCTAIVSYSAWAYDAKGNKGVSLNLHNIQMIATGERLGDQKIEAEDDFSPREAAETVFSGTQPSSDFLQ